MKKRRAARTLMKLNFFEPFEAQNLTDSQIAGISQAHRKKKHLTLNFSFYMLKKIHFLDAVLRFSCPPNHKCIRRTTGSDNTADIVALFCLISSVK